MIQFMPPPMARRSSLASLSPFARSTLIIAFFFGIDKVIGFVRSLIVNRMFGLTYDLDVFNAANNIPDLLSALISGGALGVALIPVLSEYAQAGDRPRLWAVFSRILNFAFLATALLAVIIALLAPILVSKVVAPGFPAEQQLLTIELLRLDLAAILIFSISGLVMAGLQANQHFLLPALAPGLYNIGQIFGATILADKLGMGIHGLVYGVILGALLHLGIQIPGLLKYQFRWSPTVDVGDPGVRKVLRLVGPRIATMFFIQLYFVYRDNLASGLGEGSVTALNLGWFIMQVPETLLGTAVAIALLPTISEIFAAHQTDAFKTAINQATRAVIALTIPVAVLLYITIEPLVQAAFGFDMAGTARVVLATRAYLLGLTGHALLEISARSFYAQQDAKTPFVAAALNSLAFIGVATVLSRTLGFMGIALTNSVVFTLEALALLWLLDRRFPGVLDLGRPLARVALASLVVGLLAFSSMNTILPLVTGDILEGAVAGTILLLGGTLALPALWPEIRLLLRLGISNPPLPG